MGSLQRAASVVKPLLRCLAGRSGPVTYRPVRKKKAASPRDSQLCIQNSRDSDSSVLRPPILLELMDQTDEHAVPVIQEVVDVTTPHMVLILDEEIVVGVQFIPQTD